MIGDAFVKICDLCGKQYPDSECVCRNNGCYLHSLMTVEAFVKKYPERADILRDYYAEKEAAVELEANRACYALNSEGLYEYDIVTVINELHGEIDKGKMLSILSEKAKNGWKLHTIYSNELGKNAIAVLGLGINSTACEDVMIFERRLQNTSENS